MSDRVPFMTLRDRQPKAGDSPFRGKERRPPRKVLARLLWRSTSFLEQDGAPQTLYFLREARRFLVAAWAALDSISSVYAEYLLGRPIEGAAFRPR